MKVVIDTNVFVSSVFGGLPRQVIECWFDGRITLCLSEPIVEEYQRVLREIGAVSEAEERALIEAFASDDGVLYVNDPPAIAGASADPDDDNAELVRLPRMRPGAWRRVCRLGRLRPFGARVFHGHSDSHAPGLPGGNR